MNIGLIWAAAMAAVLLPAPRPHGQIRDTVIENNIIHTRKIEGYLEDNRGYAVQHADVEVFRCPVRWPAGAGEGEVLRAGETDDTGYFNIEDVSGDQLRCVRVRKKGFQTVAVRVKLTMFSLGKMQLKVQRLR